MNNIANNRALVLAKIRDVHRFGREYDRLTKKYNEYHRLAQEVYNQRDHVSGDLSVAQGELSRAMIEARNNGGV